MIPLPLAWTLLIVLQWTSVLGSNTILLQEPVKVLYPDILGTEALECDCFNISCDSVYWFYSSLTSGEVKFLGRCNNANRANYDAGLEKERFKISKRGGSSFTLRISNVTEADTGIYSCLVKDRKNTEVWKPGVLLLPGVPSPTLTPKTKPKLSFNPVCRCPENFTQDGCGSLILWPLVGLIAILALALICILYYFSRLPKKCRHHFVKKR
uniref:T cell receptor beta variable 20-1 n=1 Tax=Semicossyphus pulcher TaxID=241346 RepID=UPI0037E8CD0C